MVLPRLLVLLLLATGFGQSLALGRMAAATEVTVCTGGGAATLTLDARGRPVRAAHDCLACLLPAFAAAPTPMAVPARAGGSRDPVPAPVRVAVSVPAPAPLARGPPSAV